MIVLASGTGAGGEKVISVIVAPDLRVISPSPAQIAPFSL
jgi:hypothetical protein